MCRQLEALWLGAGESPGFKATYLPWIMIATLPIPEYGQCEAHWWGKRFSPSGFQECQTLPGRVQVCDTSIVTAPCEVIFDYSPETHDLATLSLHHFEDDEMLGGYVHNEWVPSVRVDPENRCLPQPSTAFEVVLPSISRFKPGAQQCSPMGERLSSCPFGERPMRR